MPRSSKRRKPNKEPEPSSSSSSSDNDNDQEELNYQENIQIDLEARSPIDTDHPAILYFLEQSFGNSIKKSVLDLNQLATQLVTQQSCGSVYYQPLDSPEDETDDDDDESPVLGICSFLRLDQQQNKQIQTWLLDKCSDNEQAKNLLQCKLKNKWTSWDLNPRLFACKANTLPLSYRPINFFFVLASKCGLFINERYMNIPADISLPSIRTLREEILYPIDYWIIHSKIRLYKNDSNTIYYINGEEEIFEKYSTTSIDYHPIQSNNNEWIEKRKIIFVSTNKLDQICSDIEQKLKQ